MKKGKMKTKLLIGLFMTSFIFIFGVPLANGSLMVLAPGSNVEGQTIGEWTADWWQWATAQSVPNDAFTDPTGVNAAVGQSGPVFFIAGNTGGTSIRSFTVPVDKFLLVPLINVSISEAVFGVPTSETDLRAEAAFFIDLVDSLIAEIDGVAVPDLFDHRELSPLFSFLAAPDNPFGPPSGASGDAVSDGYWLMLEPLGMGTHTIRFGGGISGVFTVDVTDTITAVPEPSTILLLGSGLLGLVFIRRKFRK
jgi:hypothetical protein